MSKISHHKKQQCIYFSVAVCPLTFPLVLQRLHIRQLHKMTSYAVLTRIKKSGVYWQCSLCHLGDKHVTEYGTLQGIEILSHKLAKVINDVSTWLDVNVK